jgi:hypothetical protein
MDDELDHLLRAARADDATRSRASVVALRELAAEEATILGVLHDLADRRGRVRLSVRGMTRVGQVHEVWSGGVVLAGAGVEVLVRAAAIDVVSSPEGRRVHGDERSTLVHDRVETSDEVELAVHGVSMRGRVLSIGVEVVVMLGADGTTNYVRTDAIDSVVIASDRARSS